MCPTFYQMASPAAQVGQVPDLPSQPFRQRYFPSIQLHRVFTHRRPHKPRINSKQESRRSANGELDRSVSVHASHCTDTDLCALDCCQTTSGPQADGVSTWLRVV